MKRFDLHHGDCIEVMRGMADASVDSIVTDPPYELGFMGKSWDASGIAYNVDMWREALRVLKPGGHLLAFSGSRTYHRMTCAIEDAGFEIRDQIMWVYGSGFPKSKNLDGEWQGWGTALKPAHEPICVARKPLVGTVAANVLEFGTGALNINGCKVGTENISTHSRGSNAAFPKRPGEKTVEESGRIVDQREKLDHSERTGRWPANLIHDGSDEVLAAFPDAKGQQGRSSDSQRTRANTYGELSDNGKEYEPRGDTGSAARFFYCAKASKSDRNEGLEHRIAQKGGDGTPVAADNAYQRGATDRLNTHPTVKPTDLMAYLVRLVTPPCGLVLDPFMGSGSTGKAAMREGFQFVGIDMTPEYVEIATSRIEHEISIPMQMEILL